MARNFGKTWWGEQWLGALTHIDYANRIPRGATYARKGAVEKLQIEGGNIKAKVRGSRLYTVNITIPQFTDNDIQELMTRILERPIIISKMLNRELDPTLLDITNSIGLKLFPHSWNELLMKCSCPDWAVPCKHIAAVIYKIGQEIDNNPFIIFELHGVDLLLELKKRGIQMNSQSMMSPIEFKELIKQEKKKKRQLTAGKFAPDFTTLPPIGEILCNLLPASPAFYVDGDFQAVYTDKISKYRKTIDKLAKGIPPSLKNIFYDIEKILPSTQITIAFNSHLTMLIQRTDNPDEHFKDISPWSLIATLLTLPPDELGDYHPNVELLHEVCQLAVQLWKVGAVVPQIITLPSRKYAIRWLPATLDEHIAQWIEELDKALPESMPSYIDKDKKNKVSEPALWLVSLFLDQLAAMADTWVYTNSVCDLFFKGQFIAFDGIGEKNIPGGIKAWTDRFFLGNQNFRPIFIVDETTDGFDVRIMIENKNSHNTEAVPLCDILTKKIYDPLRFEILKSLSILSEPVPSISQYINAGAKEPIHFNLNNFAPFLLEAVPVIRILQAKVWLPKSLQELIRPKVSVKLSRNDTKDDKHFIRLDDLLTFNWQVAVGDQCMSPEEFEKLLHHAQGLIRYKNQYIYVEPSELERIRKALANNKPLTTAQMLQAALSGEYQSAPVQITKDAKELIHQLTEQREISLPENLNATLRPYQQRGYEWMYHNLRLGFGSIIADDMGLGKTLQVITLLLKLKQEGALNQRKTMVVAPTGLLSNWQNEIRRFAPSLSVSLYHGNNRTLDKFNTDILLTSYGILRSDSDKLKKYKWEVMVIDEAQNIKNHTTAQSKAVRSIPATNHIAMSGTPVENRLSEFWTIMDFTNHGYLGTEKQFGEQYAKPIQNNGDQKTCERFRKVTAPFMMRRLKTDKTIINDLPDKVVHDEYALLTARQAALYRQTLKAAMNEIEGIAEDSDSKTLFKRQGLILQMILALKQICNHPTQFLKNGNKEAALSGKTTMLLDMVQSIVESREKVLIFTQFKEMGDLLCLFIQERLGRTPLFYHGGCTLKQRNAMVERFQNDRTEQVFILSLKAAGTGLNLTAASHVIHYDLWWNPAVEAQATDRAYRIGQHKNVQVHRFITQNTFEEKINKMIAEKRMLADMTVTSGENWIGKLSNKELRELFS